MEDSHVFILLRLCQELSTVHEIPANHSYVCPTERMKHEVYKFHLGVDSDLDAESLTKLCEDFRNCYLCFVMSIKNLYQSSDPLIQISAEDYLKKLLKDAVRFAEDIAAEMEAGTKLVNVGRFCETIDKSQEIVRTVKEFIHKQISEQLEQMKSALEDLESENDSVEIINFVKRHVRYWEEVLLRVQNGSVREACANEIIKASQEFLTDEYDEIEQIKAKLNEIYPNIAGIEGMPAY